MLTREQETERTASEYRRARADGVPATTALAIARNRHKYGSFPWSENRRGEPSVDLPQGRGYVAHVRVVVDDSPDTSYLGEFSNRHEPGAIRHSPRGRGEYEWFIPQITEAEHYKGLRSLHYGRAKSRELARKYVRDDYERARTLGESWSVYGVVVDVTRAGIKLGNASVWGVDVGDGRDRTYLEELARELIPEAMKDARETVRAVCRGRRKAS